MFLFRKDVCLTRPPFWSNELEKLLPMVVPWYLYTFALVKLRNLFLFIEI